MPSIFLDDEDVARLTGEAYQCISMRMRIRFDRFFFSDYGLGLLSRHVGFFAFP